MLVERGCKVVIAGRRKEPLKVTTAEHPDMTTFVQMDLAEAGDRERALETVLDRHGRLDILVNNAAVDNTAPFLDQSDEDIARVIHVNLTATALLTKHAVGALSRTKGCVVNVSSTGANYTGHPSAGLSIYGTAKAGLNQLTRLLMPELGTLGVRINCVAPGATQTDLAAAALADPTVRQFLLGATPLARLGEPDDIAKVIVFLASDAASWVTGQVIDVSGGMWIQN
jgi:NAD(P)-dependent dehydrogenase (short-subunit alcohol dehydrogenase family)